MPAMSIAIASRIRFNRMRGEINLEINRKYINEEKEKKRKSMLLRYFRYFRYSSP